MFKIIVTSLRLITTPFEERVKLLWETGVGNLDGCIVAFACVLIQTKFGNIRLDGIRVIRKKTDYFIAYPQRQAQNHRWYSYPYYISCDSKLHKRISELTIEAFMKANENVNIHVSFAPPSL